MNDKDLKAFLTEINDICKKYRMIIISAADADDDSGLRSWLEICKVTNNPGRWPIIETVLECDELGTA